MSTPTDSEPFHTTTSEDALENKRLYEPESLTWKETLIEKFGNLPDNEPENNQ